MEKKEDSLRVTTSDDLEVSAYLEIAKPGSAPRGNYCLDLEPAVGTIDHREAGTGNRDAVTILQIPVGCLYSER